MGDFVAALSRLLLVSLLLHVFAPVILAWRLGSVRSWCDSTASRAAADESLIDCNNGYAWMLPAHNFDRGILPGDPNRIHAALHRLLVQKENLTIGFLGASVSEGGYNYYAHRLNSSSRPWPDWTMDVLASFLPLEARPRLVKVNAAMRGTTSRYSSLCHNRLIPRNLDVVFVEFAMNDYHGPHLSMERLVRKLLRYPRKPAVVMMNTYNWMTPVCEPDKWGDFSASRDLTGWDRDFTEIGRYYDIPVLSVRMCCHELMRQGLDGFSVRRPIYLNPQCFPDKKEREKEADPTSAHHVFYNDEKHPGGLTGSRVMGEMGAGVLLNALVNSAQAAALGLVKADAAPEVDAVIPPPMFPHNWEHSGQTCFMWEDIRTMMVSNVGWNWTDEGRNKWGWMATEPGSNLVMKLPVLRPVDGLKNGAKQHVKDGRAAGKVGFFLNYLRSYEHMGKVSVLCASGCKCEPQVVNGFSEHPRHSQTDAHHFLMTESPECVLNITLLEETEDPKNEHKFKINGFIVAEAATAGDSIQSMTNMGGLDPDP